MVKFESSEEWCLDIQLRKCQSLYRPSNPTSIKWYFPARAENPNIGEAVIKSIHCRLLCGGTVNWTVIGNQYDINWNLRLSPQSDPVCLHGKEPGCGACCIWWRLCWVADGGRCEGFWLTLETHVRPGKLSSSLAFLHSLCCVGIGKMITGEMTHRGGL